MKDRTSRRAEPAALCVCFSLRKTARAVTQTYDSALAPSGLKATQLLCWSPCRPATVCRSAGSPTRR